MDKSEYLRLLREAYINDTTKFRVSDPERPKARGYKTQTLRAANNGQQVAGHDDRPNIF